MSHHGTLEQQRRYADKNREWYRRYGRAYYRAHKQYFRDANKRHRDKVRLLIIELKNVACRDCGWDYRPWVMQFDHRPGETKCFNIGNAEKRPIKAILAEAKKCDVVCANCHATRTYNRKQRRRECASI